MNTLPHFLCIGTQKAGTSWFFHQIRQHPDVWLPPVKELHFFDHLYCPENRSWTSRHIQSVADRILLRQRSKSKVNLAFVEYVTYLKGESMFTEKWYIRAFDRPGAKGKVTGDVTPSYCTIGTKGIAYVKKLLHNPKIIWFIRNPLDRAISQLKMNISRAGVGENPSRKTWLEFTEDPVIRNRGMLSKYIPEWEKAFGPEHTLYLPYNEIAENPEGILRRVESFLQVPAYNSYRHLRTRRHESRIVDVPPDIEERLARIVRKEVIFLENRFGMDFMKSTRARVFPG